MAFFAFISRTVSSGGYPPLVLAGMQGVYEVARKANVLDGLIGGCLVGCAQALSMILLGEGLSMSQSLKSTLGLTTRVVDHDGASLAHLAILAGVVLTSATVYTANNYFHLSLDDARANFMMAVMAGIGINLNPCPWGYGGGIKSFIPLILTLLCAFFTSYSLKLSYLIPVKHVDWIVSVWSQGQNILDLQMFKGYPSPTPLVILVVASILLRLVTTVKVTTTTRSTPRRRHYEDDALTAASALIVGSLYAIGLLVGRLHSLSGSDDNYRFIAFMAVAAVTTSVCHHILLTSFPNTKPFTPIKHNPQTFGQLLQNGDQRRHTIKLYLGAVLTGIMWSLGPILTGPTIAAASGGLGGYGNLLGLILGLSVGTIVAT